MRDRRRGAALVLITLILIFVVIPVIGLAIDGGVGFLVRTRLSAAVDAAALAAGRSLSVGATAASQAAAATLVANNYVAANFPSGTFGTTPPVVNVTVDETQQAVRTVTVTAQLSAPTYFLRIVAENNWTIAATAQSSRRDVNLMLVLDRSGSMSVGNTCATMKASAQNFANKFANSRDTLGLITFMSGANVDFPPSVNFKTDTPSLNSVIGNISCGGNTASSLALWNAYTQIKTINRPGALNVIVFFTDGQPNGVSAVFPVKDQVDTRFVWTSLATEIVVPASPCAGPPLNVTSMQGVIAQWANSQAIGSTAGVMSEVDGPVYSSASPSVAPVGCATHGKTFNDPTRVSEDVAYIPAVDDLAPGNATQGTGYPPYTASDYFTGGPYAGKMRPDSPIAVIHASTTAADEQSKKITADTTYNILTFTVGLGGTSFMPIDSVFLNRIANSTQSTRFDPARPNGTYTYAPTITDLSAAFNTVAAQVLRLAK